VLHSRAIDISKKRREKAAMHTVLLNGAQQGTIKRWAERTKKEGGEVQIMGSAEDHLDEEVDNDPDFE
jgi:hypothetical protein